MPTGERFRFVRLISGWMHGVASLLITGGQTFSQTRYHATDAPDGWKDEWLPNCAWVKAYLEAEVEKAVVELRKSNALLEEQVRLRTNLLVGLRESGMANESLDDLPPTLDSLGSV